MINELTMYVVCRKEKKPIYMSKSNDIDNIMQFWECGYAVNNFIFNDKEEALKYALGFQDEIKVQTPKCEHSVVICAGASKEEIERWF